MDRKKKADGLLAGTVLICLLAAPFKETGLLGGGLFHMAFAASVGGIADLFAVSSLFGKPLGISCRTDIIARRRDQIVDMARDMVGKELFTEELLEDFLEKNLRAERILVQIEKQEELLMPLLESACRCGILAVDKGKLWKLLLREGKSVIQKENWAGRIAFALYTLKNYEGKQVLAQVLAKEVKGFLQNRFTQTEVRRLYQSAWAKYRDRGWFRGLMESFVEREETENIRLIQEQVWNLADSIVDPGSEVRCTLGKSYDSFLKRLTEDKKLQEEINTWVSANLASLLENRKDFFENLWDSHQENVEKFLAGKILDLVKNELGNPEKKERNGKFLLKQCRRHVGWLHEKIVGGVTKALSPYDGRKMASMAKKSVQNEVQAIRINGTIIGGMAGLLFYLAVWSGGIF